MDEHTDAKKQRQPQLHEVLAVDRELEAKDKEERASAIELLMKRPELFQGHIKSLQMIDEKDKIEEAAQAETVAIYLSVDAVIDQALQHTVKYMDAVAQKESTNQHARGDIILDDGTTLLENVPATALLALEKIIADVIKLYNTIPVLAAGIKWEKDTDLGAGVYKASPDIKRLKTKNIKKPITMAEATDRHPAQTALIDDTVPVGTYTEQRWSTLMLPVRKMQLLGRLEELQRAVKQARMRANTAQVVAIQNFGRKLVAWINRD